MYRCEEEARQEGMRLLEVHVKLLREARVALRSRSISCVDCTGSNQTGGERRLWDEIRKVEQKIKTWQRAYEDECLQGSNIWDIIRKEEADQNRETGVKIEKKDNDEEEDESEEKDEYVEDEWGKVAESHSNKLKRNRNETESIILRHKSGEEEEAAGKEEQMMEGKEKILSDKGIDMNRISEEDNDVVEKEWTKETPQPAEDEQRAQKRPLGETDEEEDASIKRRKVISPDVLAPRQTEGCKVFVQNLPLALHYSELRTYFMQFGTVNKIFLKNGSGCGFVIYESEATADLVCSLQHRLGDQEVKVVKDTPAAAAFDVFVFGVPLNTDTKVLASTLASFGPVVSVTQPSAKKYAFVRFQNESSKEAALQTRRITLNGRALIIRRTRNFTEEEKTNHKGEAPKDTPIAVTDHRKKGHQVFVFGVNTPLDLNGFQLGLAKFGKVVSAYMPEDKNYAFVGFETEESQRAALEAGAVNLPYGRALIKTVTQK